MCVYNVDIVAELLGTFEQAVLLTVVRQMDGAYGRSILRDVQVRLNREIAAGAIYATLDRLEEKGLISSWLEEGTPVRGGRAKRFYRVAAKGVHALNDAKSALDQMWKGTKWPIAVKI